MRKATTTALAFVAAALFALVPVSRADQINLGGDASHSVTFTNTGGPGTALTTTGFNFSGPGNLQLGASFTDNGTYSVSTGAATLTSSNGGASFTWSGGNVLFSFTDTTASSPQNGQSVTGSAVVLNVSDHTQNPKFVTALTITSNSSTGGVMSEFLVGHVYNFDFNLNLGLNPFLDQVFQSAAGSSTTGDFNIGAVVTPEPGSMILLGTGLLGLGGTLRRRIKK